MCSAMDDSDHMESNQTLAGQLFSAIKENKPSIVEEMIKKEPFLNQIYREGSGFFCFDMLPLHMATICGLSECVRILLANGADPNAKIRIGSSTALHFVNKKNIAQLLYDFGASINSKDDEGNTPLARALDAIPFKRNGSVAEKRKIKEILALFLEKGADVNAIDSKGNGLLHRAVNSFNTQAAKFLLANKVDHYKRNSQWLTAFECAIIKYVEYGASNSSMLDVFKKYGMVYCFALKPSQLFQKPILKLGETDIELCAMYAPIFASARKERYEIYKENFLLNSITFNEYGCIVHNVSKEYLKQYCFESYDAIEELLLSHCRDAAELVKADHADKLKKKLRDYPWITTYDADIASSMLASAIQLKTTDCLSALLDYKIDSHVQLYFEKPDYRGYQDTPFHYAVLYDNHKAIELLASFNSDFLKLDRHVRTPLGYALQLKREKCVKALNTIIGAKCERACFAQDYKQCKKLIEYITDNEVIFKIFKQAFSYANVVSVDDKLISLIKRFIIKGVNINRANEQKETFLWQLMIAGQAGKKIPLFEVLLKAGADVNALYENKFLLNTALLRKEYDLARLFLQYGAIVDKESLLLKDVPEDLKDLLQKETQECCVCYEHSENLSKIPCDSGHLELLCKRCYAALAKKCPICCQQLGDFAI